MEEKKIDAIFRAGLKHSEVSFEEMHWDAMEQKLQRRRRRKIISLIGIVSVGTAAAVLLFFLVLKPTNRVNTSNVQITKKMEQEKGRTVLPKPDAKQQMGGKEEALPTKQQPVLKGEASIVQQHDHRSFHYIGASLYQDSLALNSVVDRVTLASSEKAPIKPFGIKMPSQSVSDLSIHSQQQKGWSGGALTVLAAPDLTSVRGAGNASFSQNIGLLYTQPIGKRFSVSAGLLYARKNYNSPYSFYRPNVRLTWSERPTEVDAACDVLDVPLLLNYGVYHKNNIHIQVGAGISSYFMLRERYQFSYSSESSNSNDLPAAYEVRGKNNHLFGVADFSVSINRKVNENISIGIRPFVKVPLTGIGYGQTKLESKGLALTLDFKLGKK